MVLMAVSSCRPRAEHVAQASTDPSTSPGGDDVLVTVIRAVWCDVFSVMVTLFSQASQGGYALLSRGIGAGPERDRKSVV